LRRLLLLTLAVVAGCGGNSALDDEPDLAEPAAMMLRLGDLPAGFRYGDDRGCGDVWSTDGRENELDELLVETRPRWCLGYFAREWGGPPRIAQTTLFLFESDEDARRAWELRKHLFASFGRILVTTERGNGDAVVFDSNGLQQLGAGEAWRDGRLVVAVYEEGLSGKVGRGFAADLAAKQRERIETPSDPVEEDDREIGLEDPAIAIPVYWLGREFEPAGLPKLELDRADHLRGEGPGNEVEIEYQGDASGLTLDLWKPETWKRLKTVPCARRSELSVEGGRAEIYGGDRKGCEGGPDRWLAHVYYGDVVVAVTPDDAYDSREGLEAVVRGLKRR
jgi:hypothetical protein